MKLFFSPAYVAAGYAFETTRKAEWIADSLRKEVVRNVDIVVPNAVSQAQLSKVHDVTYISAVKSGIPQYLAESQEFNWDAGLWLAVTSSTGGVQAAARAALIDGVAGSLSSGLHHAYRSHGAGYCTFNGLALAAIDGLSLGLTNVLILDFDAHCGGGTHSIIEGYRGIRQIDIAVSPFDYYSPNGSNLLEMAVDGARYLTAVRAMLAQLESTEHYDLCLYNAGMDPHEYCPVGGLAGITDTVLAERERIVFEWCSEHACPVAFVLAGGYVGPHLSRQGLVALHRLTIEAAAHSAATRYYL